MMFPCRPIGDLDLVSVSGSRPGTTARERFWEHVQFSDGCWEFTAKSFNVGRKAHVPSRVAWKVHTGQEPGDLLVRHRCDNPPCVRPDHLELGTYKDNSMDMVQRGRHGRTYISLDDAEEIRRRYVRGDRWRPGNSQELMEEFGIKHSQFYRITNLQARRAECA